MFEQINFSAKPIPTGKEKQPNNSDWIYWGDDNCFPQFLVELFYESAYNNGIIESKVKHITSGGYTVEGSTESKAAANTFFRNGTSDKTIMDVIRKMTLDLEIFGGFAIKIVRKFDGSFGFIENLDFSSCRVNEEKNKIYKLAENKHPYAAKSDADTKVVRNGKEVHIQMTMIRSHFSPDNIEGIKVGDKVYFHVTNLEQDYDVPHGIAMIGANTSELLIMPGQTETFVWEPKQVGVWPFYCTDFCSALHQEMQGYVRVSPAGSKVPLSYSLGTNMPKAEGEEKSEGKEKNKK